MGAWLPLSTDWFLQLDYIKWTDQFCWYKTLQVMLIISSACFSYRNSSADIHLFNQAEFKEQTPISNNLIACLLDF
jgi:hypothetical protein